MHYAIALFPGFEALDAFGPLQILNTLSRQTPIELSILAATPEPVSTRSPDPSLLATGSVCSQEIVPTGTFNDFLNPSLEEGGKKKIDVLIVPGGVGTRFPEIIQPVIEFVAEIYPSLRYAVSVCTGAGVLARAGILDGKRATTNKIRWEATIALRTEVEWVRNARWVVDGNVWTSSGVSAGIDVLLALAREVYGKSVVSEVARFVEYVWDENDDGTRDPFA
ncbi:hypothetical protein ASPVEDRAFT_141479 [Aspergillus versicolor CBS 583.65]|uniref:DJ-1/PfpI domain-containing protein n=1 Tax=Aspergillus versicolor CBS 583.65 TaxID=1036611 RepID=A0A1L9PZT3_ASPVE|nr:uncharacterized protein ASPVEDRAFT_141479 [Aspergillus versicolor CBS 583.65]OJJ07024.1 hypothetical protein ASPVEDRAFT_141479 [Aspergillus versicolor CBS 583.65]